jgi:hypothetical protein
MTGEKDLSILLQSMKPILNPGQFVFCLINTAQQAALLNPISMFQEEEGVSVVLPKSQADENVLPYSGIFAWITLTIHSSLEAVGLTAAFSKALTNAGISCNVIAAYHHDHIFVPLQDADRAIETLLHLTKA